LLLELPKALDLELRKNYYPENPQDRKHPRDRELKDIVDNNNLYKWIFRILKWYLQGYK